MNKPLPTIESLPPIPAGAVFSYRKVDTVARPHSYCITHKHVAVAHDRFSGRLGDEAIEYAEKHYGAQCDTCRAKGLNLTYAEHVASVTVFINVPQNRDLEAVEGLKAFLIDNNKTFIALGIQGYAFPRANQ